jgi:hypothetical protein
MKVNVDNSVQFLLIHMVISNKSNSAARNCPLQRVNKDRRGERGRGGGE